MPLFIFSISLKRVTQEKFTDNSIHNNFLRNFSLNVFHPFYSS